MTGDVAPMALPAEDAIELAELLEFVHDWSWFHTRRAGESLDVFSAGGYTLDELRADLARFAFLLGGNSERFLNGGQPQ
jgi:hypothetical protein